MTNRLPIDTALDDIVASMREAPAVVLQAPPGAGKTTRVPPALHAAGIGQGDRVVVLQPRRVAARASARRIAAEQGWQLGREVGYQIRFERRFDPTTRILMVTEGILVTMLQRDPFLEGIGVVVFDEFHERHLSSDLSLAMVRRVQQEVRPDLRLLVMSATLDCEPVAHYLGGCPVLACGGREHEVRISYLERPCDDPVSAAAAGVRRVLTGTTGDLLVFLPGMAWINRCRSLLEPFATAEELALITLHGDLPAAEQDRALLPSRQRKVVLATNIAETSLTIDGVSAVVDSGLARILRFDQGCAMNRLDTVRISRASATQRAGRAGRQGPGVCLRLWTESEDRGLRAAETPEIARLELSEPVLQLLAWGESDPAAFPWFEPPPAAALEQARELLQLLGAVDRSGVTALGRQLAALPVNPRLARLLVEGHLLGDPESAAWAAAVLSERPPAGLDTGDLVDTVCELARSEQRGEHLRRAQQQLLQLSRRVLGRAGSPCGPPRDVLGRAVLAAFPDRLARRRRDEPGRALMVGGRGIRVSEQILPDRQDLLVAVELRAGARGLHSEATLLQAVAVEPEWLPEDRLSDSLEHTFDEHSNRVRCFRRRRWLDLVISESETAMQPGDEVSEELAAAAAARLSEALGLDRAELRLFLARLHCLAEWCPELALPRLGEPELVSMLPLLCQGKRSFAELQQLPLVAILTGLLSVEQQTALRERAPERLQVPSGSRIKLHYEPGRPPVLAVRLQELFGLSETPTVAGGRVKVILHLLAPSMRPQQVTDDLASFWATTYPQVRSELRGRYPRHHWPEDPLTAPATRSTRRRRD